MFNFYYSKIKLAGYNFQPKYITAISLYVEWRSSKRICSNDIFNPL